jgi:molybdopterin molybdotransferase
MSLDAALAQLLAATPALTERETLPTAEALGRVLAQDLISTVNVPPADNSAMDGYALRCADVPAPGAVLAISQRIPAGVVGAPLLAGTAARIFTGAQVPQGADAVLMQEQCEAVAGGVRIVGAVSPGLAIRRQGEDVAAGDVVLHAGRRLDAAALGLAATVGAAELPVARRPRVALFSTGDELVLPGQPLPPGAIYNSNRDTLKALLRGVGAVCTDLGIVPDRLDATRDALRRAAQGHDLILTSGGVSVGEEDHLKPAMQAEGRLDLWQVAIKPGKPLAFGAVRRGAPEQGEALFVGLPGNPVASFITFLLAVRPMLLRMQGVADADLQPVGWSARADFDWPRADKRREFLRVRRNASGGLDLYPNQGSGVLSSVAWADGVVDNPPGAVIARGDRVRFVSFAEWLA